MNFIFIFGLTYNSFNADTLAKLSGSIDSIEFDTNFLEFINQDKNILQQVNYYHSQNER